MPDRRPDTAKRPHGRLRRMARRGLAALGLRRPGQDADGSAPLPVAHASMERGHEPEERTHVGGVVLFSVGLLVLLLATLGLLAWMYALLQGAGEAATPAAAYRPVPPAPRLQHDPTLDLWQLYAREDSLLYTYGWVDRSQGVLRIPIDRAMDLIAERGLPVRDSTAHAGADTVRVLTESGFAPAAPGPPPPTAPPYRGSLRLPYAPAPDVARQLGLIRTGKPEDGG